MLLKKGVLVLKMKRGKQRDEDGLSLKDVNISFFLYNNYIINNKSDKNKI
jgi:hypothetical protein